MIATGMSNLLSPITDGTISAAAVRRNRGRTAWVRDVKITREDGAIDFDDMIELTLPAGMLTSPGVPMWEQARGTPGVSTQGAATCQDRSSPALDGTDDKQMDDSDGFSALMHANLIEIFGQRDRTRRREAMCRAYAENIAFTDPEGTVHGYDAIDERVRKVLDNALETFVFGPDGPLYILSGAAAALPWTFGPPSGPPAVRGLDIAAIADGRITSLQTLLAA
jgi:hypothetical protein